MTADKYEYTYNPHRHVKIWLDPGRDDILSLQRKQHLITMRIMNPDDDISIVYDSDIAKASEVTAFLAFCQYYKFNPVDIRAPQFLADHGSYEENWGYSKDGNILTPEKRLRLEEMRKIHPERKISIIYNEELYKTRRYSKDFIALKNFFTEQKIDSYDVRDRRDLDLPQGITEVITEVIDLELELFNRYKAAVKDNDRNLTAATKLLRWLSPVYKLGTYTDWHVKVNTQALSKTVQVKSPILINAHTLAIVDEEAAIPQINAVREQCTLMAPERSCAADLMALFQENHTALFNKQRSQWGGCLRGSMFFNKVSDTCFYTTDLSLILTHAQESNNRSRQVCVELGWLNKHGRLEKNAPDIVKERFIDQSQKTKKHNHK